MRRKSPTAKRSSARKRSSASPRRFEAWRSSISGWPGKGCQGELEETLALAKDVEGSPANWEDLAAAAQTLLAKRMVQLAVESPDNVRELVSLGRILVATEAQDVRKRRVEIDERRWEAEEKEDRYSGRGARECCGRPWNGRWRGMRRPMARRMRTRTTRKTEHTLKAPCFRLFTGIFAYFRLFFEGVAIVPGGLPKICWARRRSRLVFAAD